MLCPLNIRIIYFHLYVSQVPLLALILKLLQKALDKLCYHRICHIYVG